VDPLFDIIELVTDNFLSAPAPASRGVLCPDVSEVCTSGIVTCTPTLAGLQFDFDSCNTVVDTTLINVDGTVTVAGTPTSAILGLESLSLDGGTALTGTVTISLDECESANISITAADGTGVLGIVLVCTEYPESSSNLTLTVTVGQEVYTITFVFDTSSTAMATALDNSGAVLAICDVNLDTFDASCSVP